MGRRPVGTGFRAFGGRILYPCKCAHALAFSGQIGYNGPMYVESVPNRNSPPAVLLRESSRQGDKVVKRTLANISHWPAEKVQALRLVLKGELPAQPVTVEILRSLPHGHVAAVLGCLRRLGLDSIISPRPSRSRSLVCAMIVARVLDPRSKLATARGLASGTAADSLGSLLGLAGADEDELYQAMDWLLPLQDRIEQQLAKLHLADGSLVLYDLTSTYFEGRSNPLAKLGHSRDERPANPQIVIGLLTDGQGRPVSVQAWPGNTADPTTVAAQVDRLRKQFGLSRVVLVGDRGTITSARIRDDLDTAGHMQWITALRAPQMLALADSGHLQMSLFDTRDLAELEAHPDFAGQRLVACRNPLLAAERQRKRSDMLAVTRAALDKVVAATLRPRRPLRGKDKIAVRAQRAAECRKMAKHFLLDIGEDRFTYSVNQESIDRESSLDGIYVVRTNVPAAQVTAEGAVEAYKSLSAVERAFRSLKGVDLKVRPIHHRLEGRVRAHVLLCMLALYVEWHMRQWLAPVLFQDDKPEAGRQARQSIVAPAQRSPEAKLKAKRKTTTDGDPVHSFATAMADLATIANNRVRVGDQEIDLVTAPTPFQQKMLDLLGVNLRA